MSTAAIKIHNPDPPKRSFLWVLLTQAYAVFAAWAAFSGEQLLKAFGLSTIALTMLIPLFINFQAGLTAMIVFEPFRGFLRRAQYIFVSYSQSEPIHLLTPFVTFFAVLLLIQRQKLAMFLDYPLAKPVSLLALICLIQVFNPLQGGLFIGFTGAMFYLVPMAWFYFGQASDDEFFPRTLKLVAILGAVASCYGIYQITVGYPEFERYWITNTDQYNSIAVYNVTRALATFSNAEEWGRYVLLGSLISFGFATVRSFVVKRVLWLLCGVFLVGMIVLAGQRSSIFGLILGVAVLVVTGARSWGAAFARIGMMVAPVVLVLAFSSAVTDDDMKEMDKDQGVNTMLSHTTKGTVNPTGEGSLEARFETWSMVLFSEIPSNPLGWGLGSRTLSATREGEVPNDRPVDNHFFSLALSAGLPAMLILIWVLWRACAIGVRRWRGTEPGSEECAVWRIALALLSVFVLNNFFGTSFIIYSVAPIGWLLIGWISREESLEE